MGEATGNDKNSPGLTRMELAHHGVELGLQCTARESKPRSATAGTVYSITALVSTAP